MMKRVCNICSISSREQANRIAQGTNIVIGTIGRMLDFIEKGVIQTGKIQWVVLDEADRMLDMG